MTIPLINSPQAVTDTWSTLGNPADVRQGTKLGWLLAITKNNTPAIKFKAVGLVTGDVTEYSLPLSKIKSGPIDLSEEVFEITLAGDFNFVLKTETEGFLDQVQLYVIADAPGAIPATIDTAKVRVVNN